MLECENFVFAFATPYRYERLEKLLLLARTLITFLVFSHVCCLLHAQTVSDSLAIPPFSPGELIVKVKSEVLTDSKVYARFKRTNSQVGALSAQKIFSESPRGRQAKELTAIYLIRFPLDADIAELARKYKQSPLVEDAQPNYVRRTCAEPIIPNDEKYDQLWGLEIINMPEAWAIEKGNPEVVIAIVDGGIDYNHEDLQSKIWINAGEIPDNHTDDDNNGYIDDVRGWDFADAPTLPGRGDYQDRDAEPMDEGGHGTHVAGTAGAVVNNRVGVAGVAWNCKVMALRAGFSAFPSGSFLQDDDVSSAIVYAADNGAKVINMSWGDAYNAFVIRDAINYAYNAGCVLVAATGNESKRWVIYPAALKNVIAVAASNQFGEIYYFSNSGATVDICAPGGRILSTKLKNTYGELTGTSMAAPHVAGVAALMLSKRPSLTNEEVRQILVASSIPTKDSKKAVGAGQVDAASALAMSSLLVARIQSPKTNDGGNKLIEVMGSATGFKFTGYQLLYGETTVPEGWLPIEEISRSQKLNERLTMWDTSALEEGIYSLRLEVFGEVGNVVRDEVVVQIDHSPPAITDVKTELWLNGNRYTTVITWNTDDITTDKVYYREAGGFYPFEPLDTGYATDGHILFLSSSVPPGDYEYFITSHNAAGLETKSDNENAYYNAEVVDFSITPNGFRNLSPDFRRNLATEKESALPAMHLATTEADFDGDGRLEIVGMEIGGSGYAPVKIYERDDAGNFELVFTSRDVYFPWAVADTDGDGFSEILSNNREVTFLMEPHPGRVYPGHKIWEVEGIWGGQIADLDKDGKPEIISRHDDTNEIYIHEATGDDSYERVAILPNPTEGDNGLGTATAIGDFDGDGLMEIATGDDEAELFVYENTGDNQFRQTWQGEMVEGQGGEPQGVSSAHYLAAGDLDGDGKDEFIVGGKVDGGKFGFARKHWVFSVFKANGDDTYESVWTQAIMFIRPGGNGVSVGDIEGDGKNEFVIVTWPDVYIFQYGADTFVPIWHHTASSTFNPMLADLDGNGSGELLFNEEDKLAIYAPDIQPETSLVPWGLVAIPLNETSVYLIWKVRKDVSSYNIYRGTDEEHLEIIARNVSSKVKPLGQNEAEFIDTDLTEGRTYWYAVSAQTPVGTETQLSEKVSAKPGAQPTMISAEYKEPNRVIVLFDKRMGASAQSQNQYYAQEVGKSAKNIPSSALLDRSKKRVILTFDAGKLLRGKSYDIVALNVWDADKTLISSEVNSQRIRIPAEEIPNVPTDLTQAIAYPNPVSPNEYHVSKVIFANLPGGTKISIYNITGELIEQLDATDGGKKEWLLLNNAGTEIASGVYIYILEADGKHKSGKVTVVK